MSSQHSGVSGEIRSLVSNLVRVFDGDGSPRVPAKREIAKNGQPLRVVARGTQAPPSRRGQSAVGVTVNPSCHKLRNRPDFAA